jgi:hypothetical protein
VDLAVDQRAFRFSIWTDEPGCCTLPPNRFPGGHMRTAAVALVLSLFAMPSFASRSRPKGPTAGQFCPKAAIGTTAQDKSGATLTCKADKKGKGRWTK